MLMLEMLVEMSLIYELNLYKNRSLYENKRSEMIIMALGDGSRGEFEVTKE